jgi:hypothetical protein
VALDLLASPMDHGEWFHGEAEKDRAAASSAALLEHDDFAPASQVLINLAESGTR